MRIDILTVVPSLLESPFAASIMQRAKDKGHVEIYIHNIRDYSTNKHKNVDDYQYGGGAGMVRCFLHCVCWGGSFNNCNGGGTPLAFPPCKLDQLASTAGTGMAVIYWKNP